MSTKQDMKLADVFWKLDALAECTVIDDEASTAARDAVRALREVARSLGVDPAQGADSISAAVEALQERFRQARQQVAS
ncbi:hypothetical protein ACK8QS_22690 (plasmid) [Ectopseudomonas mendocina]